MCTIIGRKQEIAELNRYYGSGRAEFIAIYGRRRVGKTFLINEVLGDYMTFTTLDFRLTTANGK